MSDKETNVLEERKKQRIEVLEEILKNSMQKRTTR